MVLGLGEGSIEIKMDKSSFSPNEAAKGTVILTLGAPRKARELRITFYGEITKHRHTYSSGHRKSTSSVERVYEQKVSLGGEAEYPIGTREYPFELRIPDIARKPSGGGEGVVGAITGFFSGLSDPLANARWFFDASLDVPMSFDITRKIQVSIER